MDIQDCISIDQERGVVTVILPRAFALLGERLDEDVNLDLDPEDRIDLEPARRALKQLQVLWPNVPDQIHDAAMDGIIAILRRQIPGAASFRIVGPKRSGGSASVASTGGAGGTDPDVVVR